MSIDISAALRRLKPDKHRRRLASGPRVQLETVADLVPSGPSSLVLDTNVYINDLAGRLSLSAQSCVDSARIFHCSVCIGELAVGIGNADPAHANWASMRDYYTRMISTLPASRILSPDAQVWAEAGLLAGILARTQDFQPHQRKDCLNDALIYLTAAKVGIPVLTSNRDEFDLIQQVAKGGRFIAC